MPGRAGALGSPREGNPKAGDFLPGPILVPGSSEDPRGWEERNPRLQPGGDFGADLRRFGADLNGAIPSSHRRDSGPTGPIPSPQKRSFPALTPRDFPASGKS